MLPNKATEFLKRIASGTACEVLDSEHHVVLSSAQVEEVFTYVIKRQQGLQPDIDITLAVVNNPYTDELELIVIPDGTEQPQYSTSKIYRPAYRIDTSPNIQNKARLYIKLGPVGSEKAKNKFNSLQREINNAFMFRNSAYCDHPYFGPKYIFNNNESIYIFSDRATTDLYRLQEKLTNSQRKAVYFKFGNQLLEGLAEIHAAGFIHNDIKNNNILCYLNSSDPTDGNIKISDFAYVRKIGVISASGTTAFFSPERVANAIKKEGSLPKDREFSYGYKIYQNNTEHYKKVSYFSSTKDDMWAAGITLFELITGKLPVHCQQKTIKSVFKQHPLIGRLMNPDREIRPDAKQAIALLAKENKLR